MTTLTHFAVIFLSCPMSDSFSSSTLDILILRSLVSSSAIVSCSFKSRSRSRES